MVLLHGACFGPETMSEAARRLSRHRRVLLVHRRGYGASASLVPGARIGSHVEDVIDVLDREGCAAATVVGVSGGATIAVAVAVAHPDRVPAIVAHEPALGALAPGVNGVLSAGLGAINQATDPADGAEAMGVLLAGPDTWRRLPAAVRAGVRDRGEVVAREVPAFVGFSPTVDDLRGLRAVRVVSSVGAWSRPQRMEAARVLAAHSGGAVAVVPRCGHLVQIDAPAALAAAVARLTEER